MPKHLLELFYYDVADEQATSAPQVSSQPESAQMIDYDKIASIVQGKQNVAEDTVLRNYFKQQGLSGEEMAQAITSFKEQKAAATPDVNAMQAELKQAQAVATKAVLERNAQLSAIKHGVPVATLPYVLKLADLSSLTAESSEEDFDAVIAKVLADVPALKPEAVTATGFHQVGSTGQTQQTNTQDAINKAFGL